MGPRTRLHIIRHCLVHGSFSMGADMREAGDNFHNVGRFRRFRSLDAMSFTALMECIPGGTHLLRQQLKNAKSDHRTNFERNISRRQVFWMTCQDFAMNEQGKNMTDTARLHTVILPNGDLQQFIDRRDGMISIMRERHTDDDLLNLFVI